jgi:hypothetical protein
MASYAPLKIRYNPVTTYPGTTQNNWIGAQSVAGRRGTLPTFNDTNAYWIAKNGDDGNSGTQSSPKKTLGSIFATGPSLSDNSGQSDPLVVMGTVPYLSYPCRPIPPQGNFAVGPFNDSNYLTAPSDLRAALSNQNQFCYEAFIFLESHKANTSVFRFQDNSGVNNTLLIASNGQASFYMNNVAISSAAGAIVLGNWYYIACVLDTSGQRLYIGDTPETAVLVAQNSTPRTIQTISTFYIGRSTGAGESMDGYQDRIVISSTARTKFPTAPGASGIQGLYTMETSPLMQTAPKDYIVVKDSEVYNEGLYANFPHEDIGAYGIYAADGEAPIFTRIRGAVPGTYGAGNPARVVSGTPNYYISKSGNDGTGTRGNPALPFLTIQAALDDGARQGDDILEIQDSGLYRESLSLSSPSFTLRAKQNQVPVLNSIGPLHLNCINFLVVQLDGLSLSGVGAKALFAGVASSTLITKNCSVAFYDDVLLPINNKSALFTTLLLRTLKTSHKPGMGFFSGIAMWQE